MVSGRPYRGMDRDCGWARRSCHDAPLRLRCDADAGRAAQRTGASLALSLRLAAEFAAAAPKRPRSRAVARYSGADRAADEGGRADRDESLESLAGGARRARFGSAEAALAADCANEFSAVRRNGAGDRR